MRWIYRWMISATRCWFGVKVGASPTGSRRSNTENQRNDLISNDCGTIASPCRRVTICIHDYRPRKAERTRGKKGWIPWERQVEAKCQKCTYIRLHSHTALSYRAIIFPILFFFLFADRQRIHWKVSLVWENEGRHASRYFFNWLSLRNTLFEISWRWKGSWLFSKRKIHHFSRRCITMQFQKRKKLFRLLLAIYDREGERNMVPTDTRVTWIRGWPFIRFATAVIAHLDNFKRTGRGDARKRNTRPNFADPNFPHSRSSIIDWQGEKRKKKEYR